MLRESDTQEYEKGIEYFFCGDALAWEQQVWATATSFQPSLHVRILLLFDCFPSIN